MSNARRAAVIGLSAAWLTASALGCGKGSSASGTSGQPIPGIPPGALPIPAETAPVAVAPPVPARAILNAEGLPVSFAPLARRADPAVATVKSRVERTTQSGRRRVVAEGLGTAFVYDPEGYLLTNNHVIEDATDVMVGFFDGREFKATVIGRDKHTDIAVLKIEKTGLPSVPLGDSDAIDVGDWVVAIGNPFGLSHTVSAGILSAKGRTRDDVKGLDPSGYFNFLQTDASINPGNSSGPLLNARGEVVGINAAVRANANSIGFAIPINMVKQLLPTLLRDGKLRRSAIGVEVDPLNPVDAARLHRPDRKGAWVTRVLAGGPAERAGLSADDVIVSFDGKPIEGPNELRWLASIAGVNKIATVRVARAERTFDLRVTLGELADQNDSDDER